MEPGRRLGAMEKIIVMGDRRIPKQLRHAFYARLNHGFEKEKQGRVGRAAGQLAGQAGTNI